MKRLVRKYLRNFPGIKGGFDRIDEARRERNVAIAERDAASAKFTGLFVPPGHYYSPIVDPNKAAEYFRQLAASPVPEVLPGIAVNRSEMRLMWEKLLPFLVSCPFTAEPEVGLRYYYDNPAYSYADGSILHAMIRTHKPKVIIEIGSGWSSACMLDTIDTFLDGACKLTCIEPYPQVLQGLIRSAVDRVNLLAHDVQRTPLAVFDELQPSDILFIDSSHIVATGSDVCFELFQILPRLKPGVLVHFHDMFWPFEYPQPWVVDENRSWNELYAVRAFLTDNPQWTILFFNNYFARFEEGTISKTFPLFLKNSGGALWIMRN
jgi:predicted O-methyltransferase YrrM